MTCIRDLVDPAGIATEIYSAAAALGKSIKSNAGADTMLRSRSHHAITIAATRVNHKLGDCQKEVDPHPCEHIGRTAFRPCLPGRYSDLGDIMAE